MSGSSTRDSRGAGTAGLTWAAGFVVALGAAVATAHGLYEVAHASGAPAPIAALYPLITDGLALVAYAATTRLADRGRRYAWTIVVLAAGLSGLAQAAFLAGGGVGQVPAWLRFGVGAWPATAAAIVAHLLYLLGVARLPGNRSAEPDNPYNPLYSCPTALDGVEHPGCTPSNHGPDPAYGETETDPGIATAPARERATAAALTHRRRHGALPSVSELAVLAQVARGTAANALRDLRDPVAPRVIPTQHDSRTDR